MARPKNLVLFVEGEGDEQAVPVLVKRLLRDLNPWEWLVLDPDSPFKVGEIGKLFRDDAKDWRRYLQAAMKKKDVGGILLVVDGDAKKVGKRDFCASHFALELGKVARTVGAGTKFSVAVVFACQEYESWLIAGVESLAEVRLPADQRLGVKAGVRPPADDLEAAPRDAKKWLSQHMECGYKPTTEQKALTELVKLDLVRSRNMRSFRRLENALTQLVEAFRTGTHIVSPVPPPPPPVE